MKHVKLFEQFINEAKALPLDKLVKMIGNKPSCYDLADFIYANYDKVTGLRKSMRDEEMDFPSEIEDLVDHYGFDIIDFTDCYGMAAESLVNENELHEKKYSDEERKELEQKGMAMPGGRFPVKDSTDLKNAIWLLPKAKGDVEEVIKFLAKRLKELGATNYENMFNKTLHTMGINKDVTHFVSEGFINEGKTLTATLSYENPQSAEFTMNKADKKFQDFLRHFAKAKVISSKIDKVNYGGVYTLDGDAKAVTEAWDKLKKSIEKQDSFMIEEYGILEWFDLEVK